MNGKITISRIQSNQEDYLPISIEIEDDDAGIKFLKIKMSLNNFANAITGMGYTDCKIELNGLEKVGKRREIKHEIVPIPENKRFRKKSELELAEFLKPFEIDGWEGSQYDLNNSKNLVPNGCKVLFVRWVDKI